jgi:hypothetical protein
MIGTISLILVVLGFIVLVLGPRPNNVEIAKTFMIAACALGLFEIAYELVVLSSKFNR